MKFTCTVLAATIAAVLVDAYSLPNTDPADISRSAALRHRALPNSPNGYTPSRVTCPANPPSVRSASSLSQNETAWLQLRRNNTIAPMREFLIRMNISDFDAGAYIDRVSQNASELPNIGIAMSGGGWRALSCGAGVLQAFDSRTENSTNTGQIGGLLQSATYLSGLSGGGWLVGSLIVNNYTTVTALRDDDTGSVWEFGRSILQGPATNGIQVLTSAEYYDNIYNDVTGKRNAGFDVSLTEFWGRGLSYQLINATRGGSAYTWSSIALTEAFRNADMPFPIVVADAREPGQTIISLNTSVYEFSPFEMGTWDPTVYGFIPLQYLGTNFSAGAVTNTSRCVVGFDNAGFVMGTSSSLFNQYILNFDNSTVPDYLLSSVLEALNSLDKDSNDIADYSPNPFLNYNPESNPSANSYRLTLVDGGEDLQNVPLHPLIQPVRGVDVIFAVDSSADNIYNWPNATALVATYERQFGDIANGTVFPSIPDQNTVVNLGLNTRPTFFGCDTSNMTDGINVPLIVYIPNSPYVAYSNESTLTFETNNTVRNAMIYNGYHVATMGNGTVDSMWPTCVGCAILWRSMEKTNTAVPPVCQNCFNQYCWNGNLNSTEPATPYAPTPVLGLQSLTGSASAVRTGALAFIVAGMALIATSL